MQLELHVAPAHFSHLVVFNERGHFDEVREYFASRMQEQTEEVKKTVGSGNSITYIDDLFVLLGTECCLLTRDNYCFIRKRGGHTLLAPNRWSTGLSGYVGNAKMLKSGLVDIVAFLIHEMGQKMDGNISGSTSEIRITGLHKNTETNAIDILCYWRLDMNAKQLVNIIGGDQAENDTVFLTQNMPSNNFMSETSNFLFSIDPANAQKAFAANNIQIDQIEPESLMSIHLALKSVSNM
jgi:hypothetical protein